MKRLSKLMKLIFTMIMSLSLFTNCFNDSSPQDVPPEIFSDIDSDEIEDVYDNCVTESNHDQLMQMETK